MKLCKVIDYKMAFDSLVEWLNESRGVVEENMPDPDDEVAFAKADGYLTCCRAAIVLAEDFRNKAMKTGRGKND